MQSEVEELLPGYLERRFQDLERIRDYLSENRLKEIATMAHKIKGTGTGYGMPDLTKEAAKLEDAAKSGQKDLLQSLIEGIESILQNQLQSLNNK